MDIKVKGFDYGQPIPRKYTCQGDDVSPEIIMSGYPAGTKSLALIMEDPDAPVGIFTHWIIYNIPTSKFNIQENVEKKANLFDGISQGINDFGKTGYNGPCPPRGHGPHRYFFRLMALSNSDRIEAGLNRDKFYKEIGKFIIGQVEWMGTYERV